MTDFTLTHATAAEENWGPMYYHVLPKIINQHNFKIGAEIGVAFGGHLNVILSNTEVDKMYGIDAYKCFHNTTDSFVWQDINYSQKEYDDLYQFTADRLLIFKERIELLRNSSEEAADIINEPLDFIFIDAQHTKEGVTSDLKLWFDKVKSGGVMSGHDYYHPSFPGVQLAVDEFFTEKKLTINSEDGYVWWVKKD